MNIMNKEEFDTRNETKFMHDFLICTFKKAVIKTKMIYKCIKLIDEHACYASKMK